jgi:hypothetical protein
MEFEVLSRVGVEGTARNCHAPPTAAARCHFSGKKSLPAFDALPLQGLERLANRVWSADSMSVAKTHCLTASDQSTVRPDRLNREATYGNELNNGLRLSMASLWSPHSPCYWVSQRSLHAMVPRLRWGRSVDNN